jgi:hypothetical protein
MQRPQRFHTPEIEIVWPVPSLGALSETPIRQSAIILVEVGLAQVQEALLDSGLLATVVSAGAELLAFVGAEAEQEHDATDWELDRLGADHVVTTWHSATDPEDVADFVCVTSRTSALTRVLLVGDASNRVTENLKNAIERAIVDTSRECGGPPALS